MYIPGSCREVLALLEMKSINFDLRLVMHLRCDEIMTLELMLTFKILNYKLFYIALCVAGTSSDGI